MPLGVLPGWAQAVAPLTPSYWAMRGFMVVILEAGGVAEVLLPLAVLVLFTGVFAGVAATRFRFHEVKSAVA